MEIRIPGVRKLRERSERGNPLSTATKRPHLTIIMKNLLKALSQHATQSGMITKLGLLKSGKLTLRCVSDRGNPLSPLGERHASLAQSIVDEVIPRDRPGQPVVIPQRGARPQ